MTQFQPPPDAPGSPPFGPPGNYQPPGGEPAWSVAAVSGFVLSLLGCAGVTAVVGFLLGIVGIVRTANHQRRGRGLAIAAIPISLVTGALSFVVALMLFNVTQLMAQVPGMLTGDIAGDVSAVTVLQNIASSDFNREVNAERLDKWFETIRSTHGKIVEFGQPQRASTSSGKTALAYEIKCINGPATLKVVIHTEGFRFTLDDIAIDELSPRDIE